MVLSASPLLGSNTWGCPPVLARLLGVVARDTRSALAETPSLISEAFNLARGRNGFAGSDAEALFIAVAEHEIAEKRAERVGPLYSLVSRLHSASPRARRAILAVLNSVDLKVEWTPIQLRNFISKLYRVAYREPGTRAWVARRFPPSEEREFQELLDVIVIVDSVESALKGMGRMREVLSGTESLRHWIYDHPNASNGVRSVFLNGAALLILGNPFHLPYWGLNRSRLSQPEIIERARRLGSRALYEEFRSQRGEHSAYRRAFNSLTQALGALALGIGVAGIISDGSIRGQLLVGMSPTTWLWTWQKLWITEEDLKREEDEEYFTDPEAFARGYRLRQFESFRNSYIETDGPFEEPPPYPWDPDFERRAAAMPPGRPGYRAEALAEWETLQNTSPEQCRVIHQRIRRAAEAERAR